MSLFRRAGSDYASDRVERPTPQTTTAAKVRAARIELARRENWREIPAERLVERGFGRLLDVESDLLYTVRRGATFEQGRANLVSAPAEPWFFVDRDGDVILIEPTGLVWSEIVERRERQRARAAAS